MLDDNTATDNKLRRWEEAAEWPLMIAAFAFLVAYAWTVLHENLPQATATALAAVTWAAWALFAVDFLVRVGLADDRRHYVLRHLHDLVVIVLPLLRPLRLLRLVTVIGALNRRAGAAERGICGWSRPRQRSTPDVGQQVTLRAQPTPGAAQCLAVDGRGGACGDGVRVIRHGAEPGAPAR